MSRIGLLLNHHTGVTEMEKFYEDTDIVTVVIVTDRNRVEKQMYAHMARQLLEYVIKDHICARATFNGSDHNDVPFSFDVSSAAFAVYLKDDGRYPKIKTPFLS